MLKENCNNTGLRVLGWLSRAVADIRAAEKENGFTGGDIVEQQLLNKVLIVEDEEILASNIMTHIQRHGWEARIAPNGKQAMSSLEEFTPQVILLDYHLPDMTGFQILDAICATYGPCPCVLMTGHPTEVIFADAERHGVAHILCKPFPLADMASSLGSAVQSICRDVRLSQAAAPAVGERRQGERRSLASRIFKALRLADGSWLTCDRRAKDRRR